MGTLHLFTRCREVSTHSRLKAAGISYFWIVQYNFAVSTHSRLKAAGPRKQHIKRFFRFVSTHSRLKAAGYQEGDKLDKEQKVSTHSRLKAAGSFIFAYIPFICCFNTQPPEGGWFPQNQCGAERCGFNTQPPEGGWQNP